jgi:hypothetical protein
MSSSGMLSRVALVRTDVSEARITSSIMVTRIGELQTTLALTSSVLQLLVIANVVLSLSILVTLMMETTRSPKRRFLQEPHEVTTQKTTFFYPMIRALLRRILLQFHP